MGEDGRTPPQDPDEEETESLPAPSRAQGRIGPYRILETLGEGGMGIVYLAEQEVPIRRRVALKIIKPGMDSKQVLARFESERQALAILGHPNIAKVFDAGATEQGHPYFVMEHVAGVPITEYCDKHLLSNRERLDLFIPVCEAIQHAHNKGIIHRDIKPSNVLVAVQDGKPVPKVIDFGVAKATSQRLTERTLFTEQGVLIGTPDYMSPEQAEMSALDVDSRTDIYSLGVLLYELLVGALPFDPKAIRRAGYVEMQRIIREEEPPTPSARISGLGAAAGDVSRRRQSDVRTLRRNLRGDLDWIVMKALQKDRTRRYAAATELARDLARHLRDERVVTGPARLWSRTRSGLLSALVLGLIPGVLGILLVYWGQTENLERFGLDLLFQMRGVRPQPTGVCVVALDDDSYGVLEVDPTKSWPRRLHADLIRALKKEGAAAVGFDVLFQGAGDPAQDDALETAIAEAGNVVLGASVDQVEDPLFRQARLMESVGPFVAAAAAAIGVVGLSTDSDGVIRSAWLTPEERPTLSLVTYEVATGDRSHRAEPARLIDYYGPARSVRTVSFYQALDPAQYLGPGFFRGKIVFVGLSQAAAVGPTSRDAFLTPFRGPSRTATFGVEIHATIAANLLEGRHIDLLPPVSEGALLLLLPLFATLVVFYLRPFVGAFAVVPLVALALLTWAAAYLAFARAGVWTPVIIPTVVQLPIGYIGILLREFFLRKPFV